MNRQIRFTKEQIETLLNNQHVAKCSEKTITYAKEFKLLAVERHNQGLNAVEIFRDAGFDRDMVGRNLPYKCLNRWLKTCKARGPAGLNTERRGISGGGGRPRTRGLTDADKVKRLEIEIAYLKAENDFLVKLRASKKS